MQSSAPRFEARDYVRIIQKRKWFIILVGLAAMLIGGLYAVSYPKVYRASSLVLVRHRPEGVVWLTEPSARSESDIAIDTQASMIQSAELAGKVAKALQERRSGERIVTDLNEVQQSLSVETLPPDRIRIHAQSTIERNAVAFANEAATQFLDMNTEFRRRQDKRTREYLEEQLVRTEEQLDEVLDEIAAYQNRIGAYTDDAGAPQILKALADYRSAREAASADLSATRAQLRALDKMIAQERASGRKREARPNPAIAALQRELSSAQVALAELRGRYHDSHPAIHELERRVASLRAQIKAEPPTVDVEYSTSLETGDVSRQRVALLAREADLVARIASIDKTVAELTKEARSLPEKLRTLTRLKSRSELLTETRARLLEELEAKRLEEEAKGGTAMILDTAQRGVSVSPSVSRALLFAGVLGLVAGVALALVLEALDDTIRSPEELTRDTQVPFLGMVPLMETGAHELITVSAPKSPPAEAYRTLRSNVTFSLVEEPARRFLITSAGAGEGKSLTAANLAVVFAQAGQSVLLVDSDLRRPCLHRFLHCDSTRGLTNVLVGECTIEDVLQDTHVEGLRLLASGPLPPNPAEMLDSAAMRRLIDELQHYADVMIFDSPPVLVLTDAVILSSKIDRTILVAESGQVTRQAFNEAVRLLNNARARVLGVVLNKLRLSASDYYYYYYYYDYTHEAPRTARAPSAEEVS